MNEKSTTRLGIVSGILTTGLLLAAAVLLVRPSPVKAWATPPCDFLTGGGWIVHNGAKANFGVGGGCKHGSPTWGHLEYQDHGTGLNAHWRSEEHTSELQSHSDLVCRLLLEKKNKKKNKEDNDNIHSIHDVRHKKDNV